MFEGAEIGVLQHLLGIGVAADDRAGQAVEALIVALDDLPDRARLPQGRTPHEVGFVRRVYGLKHCPGSRHRLSPIRPYLMPATWKGSLYARKMTSLAERLSIPPEPTAASLIMFIVQRSLRDSEGQKTPPALSKVREAFFYAWAPSTVPRRPAL